jgi:hypothetical protein
MAGDPESVDRAVVGVGIEMIDPLTARACGRLGLSRERACQEQCARPGREG